MNTNALAALELIRQTLGMRHRATPNEIVQEVKRRIIPVPRARVLPESDDLEIGPRRDEDRVRLVHIDQVAPILPWPIPSPREMVEKASVETPPAPRAPIILPSLTKAPVDRLAIIRAAAERGRA